MALQCFRIIWGFLALCFCNSYSSSLFAFTYFHYTCFVLILRLYQCSLRDFFACGFCVNVSILSLSHHYSLRYSTNIWSLCSVGLSLPVMCYLKLFFSLRLPKIDLASPRWSVTWKIGWVHLSFHLFLPSSSFPFSHPWIKAETGEKKSWHHYPVAWGYMAHHFFLFWWFLWAVIPLAGSFAWTYVRMTFPVVWRSVLEST